MSFYNMSSLPSTWTVFSLLIFILLFHCSTQATLSDLEKPTPVTQLNQQTTSSMSNWLSSYIIRSVTLGVVSALLYFAWSRLGDETPSKKEQEKPMEQKRQEKKAKLKENPKQGPKKPERDLKQQIERSKDSEVNAIHGCIMQEIEDYPSEEELKHLNNSRQFLIDLTSIINLEAGDIEDAYNEICMILEQMAAKEYTFPIFQKIVQYLLTQFGNDTSKMKSESRYELREFKIAIHVEWARKLYLILERWEVNREYFKKNKAMIIQWSRLVTIWETLCHIKHDKQEVEEETTSDQLIDRLNNDADINESDVKALRGFCMSLIRWYLNIDTYSLREFQKPGSTVDSFILDELISRLYTRYDPNRFSAPLKEKIQQRLEKENSTKTRARKLKKDHLVEFSDELDSK